jgi:hypothetical protein
MTVRLAPLHPRAGAASVAILLDATTACSLLVRSWRSRPVPGAAEDGDGWGRGADALGRAILDLTAAAACPSLCERSATRAPELPEMLPNGRKILHPPHQCPRPVAPGSSDRVALSSSSERASRRAAWILSPTAAVSDRAAGVLRWWVSR